MYRICTPLLSIVLVTCAYGMDSSTTTTPLASNIPQQSHIAAMCKAVAALPSRVGRAACTLSRTSLQKTHNICISIKDLINTYVIMPAHQHPYKAALLVATIFSVYLFATKTACGKKCIASIAEKVGFAKKNKRAQKENKFLYRPV